MDSAFGIGVVCLGDENANDSTVVVCQEVEKLPITVSDREDGKSWFAFEE